MKQHISRRMLDITGKRDIVQRRIAALSMQSEVPGPVVWLTACIHGEEVGGTVIVHEVFEALRKAGLKKGSVHALPLVNTIGFENISRYINNSGEDLNRCFPGDPRGSMGQQIARRVFDAVLKTQPDLLIDLHNDWIQSVPYILVEPPDHYAKPGLREQTLSMVRAARLPIVEDTDTWPETHNTLAGAMVAANVPAVTIEAGGAYTIVEECVTAGVAGILAILHNLGMTDDAPANDGVDISDALLRYTNRPLATTNGLVRFEVTPGQHVSQGQVLARVYSAFGACDETLKARAPGYVLGLQDHARVLPGGEIIAIAETPDS